MCAACSPEVIVVYGTVRFTNQLRLVLRFAINPSRLSVRLPFRSNTKDALNSKACTKPCPMLPLKRRGVSIIANSITPHTAANRVINPKRKDIAAKVSRAVKK